MHRKNFDPTEKIMLYMAWVIFKKRGNTFEEFIAQLKMLVEFNEGKEEKKMSKENHIMFTFDTRLQIAKEFKAGAGIRLLTAKYCTEGVKIEEIIREFLPVVKA